MTRLRRREWSGPLTWRMLRFICSYSGPSVEEDDAEKQVLRSYMPAESEVWLPATGCLEREVNDLLCLSGEW